MGSSSNCVLIVALIALQILSQHKVSAIGEKCRVYSTGQLGMCVDIRQCPEYVKLLQSQTPAAVAFLRSTLCYLQSNDQPVVCCAQGGISYPHTTTSLPIWTVPQQSHATTARPAESSYWPLYPPDCGYTDAEFHRVVGGKDAKLGAWPWVAALGYLNRQKGELKWLCGGSLVSRRHIVTAGHCVYNRTDLAIARLGEHDLYSDTDGANPIDVYIKRGIIHPEYNPVTYENDIAVLRLKDEIKFTDAIHPICLPLADNLRNRDITGKTPFIAGWGALYFRGPSSKILQEVQLPVVSEQKCKEAYARIPQEIHIDGRVLCAGYAQGGKDACQGDSGGGLMYPQNSAFYIFGVVSFGFRCAEAGYPGVYSKVGYFLDFVVSNLN